MIVENDLILACQAVSSKYGEDIGQDVAVILLKWEKQGTLLTHDSLSLKRLALYCGSLEAKHQRQRNFPGNRTLTVGEGLQKNFNEFPFRGIAEEELVKTESVEDRMSLCRLKRLLLGANNQRCVAHALGITLDKPVSRARFSQLLIPFVKAGYIKKKVNKRRTSNFKLGGKR